MPTKTKQRIHGKTRSAVSSIARERIDILLSQARERAGRDPELAGRYVELARKISMRTKVRIPRADKRYLCKKCGQPLVPGRNARVRVSPGNPRVVVTCLSCGAFRRYPFTKQTG
jgi:ribonuclease P protein subunit RPR2